jgi:hypothetical protein
VPDIELPVISLFLSILNKYKTVEMIAIKTNIIIIIKVKRKLFINKTTNISSIYFRFNISGGKVPEIEFPAK